MSQDVDLVVPKPLTPLTELSQLGSCGAFTEPGLETPVSGRPYKISLSGIWCSQSWPSQFHKNVNEFSNNNYLGAVTATYIVFKQNKKANDL